MRIPTTIAAVLLGALLACAGWWELHQEAEQEAREHQWNWTYNHVQQIEYYLKYRGLNKVGDKSDDGTR
jgi:hypothetical protein